ncbi:hypothetical protein ACFSKN_04635 [Mariniflexile gromovii]|uniref:Transposase n=1 Tax=Mariniflexile gromovii TaxID=362523 RepID=A0ABS4BW93_9FLAO|nr:hypothetical protein [Mariniflexile gromovii]MBP0904866.1 hypothetical protein [Mariniflexile gromovii]
MNEKVKEMIIDYHKRNPKYSINQLSKVFGLPFENVWNVIIPNLNIGRNNKLLI